MKNLLIILLISLAAFSCRTKHKITSRGQHIEKAVVKVKSTGINKVTLNKERDSVGIIEKIKIDKTSVVDLTQADPDKEFSFEYSDGSSFTVRGANVKITNSETAENETDSSAVSERSELKEESETETESESETDEEDTFRNSNSESSSPSTIIQIGLAFAFCIGAVFLANKYIT